MPNPSVEIEKPAKGSESTENEGAASTDETKVTANVNVGVGNKDDKENDDDKAKDNNDGDIAKENNNGDKAKDNNDDGNNADGGGGGGEGEEDYDDDDDDDDEDDGEDGDGDDDEDEDDEEEEKYDVRWLGNRIKRDAGKWYPYTPIVHEQEYVLLLQQGLISNQLAIGANTTTTSTTTANNANEIKNDQTRTLHAKMLLAILHNMDKTNRLIHVNLLNAVVDTLLGDFQELGESSQAYKSDATFLIWIPIFFMQYILVHWRIKGVVLDSPDATASSSATPSSNPLASELTIETCASCFPPRTREMLDMIVAQYPRYSSAFVAIRVASSDRATEKKNMFMFYNYTMARIMQSSQTFESLGVAGKFIYYREKLWTREYEDHALTVFSIWFYRDILLRNVKFMAITVMESTLHPTIRKQSTFATGSVSTLQLLPDHISGQPLDIQAREAYPRVFHDKLSHLLTIMYAGYFYQFPVFESNTHFYMGKPDYGEIVYKMFARRMLTANAYENQATNAVYSNEPGLSMPEYRSLVRQDGGESITRHPGGEISLGTGNRTSYDYHLIRHEKLTLLVCTYRPQNVFTWSHNLVQILVTHPSGALLLASDVSSTIKNRLIIGRDTRFQYRHGELLKADTTIRSVGGSRRQEIVHEGDGLYVCRMIQPTPSSTNNARVPANSTAVQPVSVVKHMLGYTEMLNGHDSRAHFDVNLDHPTNVSILLYTRERDLEYTVSLGFDSLASLTSNVILSMLVINGSAVDLTNTKI